MLQVVALVGLVALVTTAPAQAQAPGLPRTYNPMIIDSADPAENGAFGWGVSSADVTGDGKADLLVAQSQVGPGRIFIYNGVTGAHVDTIDAPESNPDVPTMSPVLGFVYVETMPDLGSCPGGDGADADKICDLATIGPGDDIPEIIVGSRNLRVDSTDGSAAPDTSDPRIGRAYVFDGATRAVLKRIDMPQAERQAQQQLNATPQFGRQTISPQALPPCAGPPATNNNVGVGECLPTTARFYSERVRIGDLNGGGEPDILITARNYRERGGGHANGPTAVAGSHCATSTSVTTCDAGKSWAYAGEDIAGTDPQVILETPIHESRNPRAQGSPPGGQEFGGNLHRVGDLNDDGAPEFAIPARGLAYPLANPDTAWENVGAFFLFNGANGALMRTYQSPEPQPRSFFGGSFNGGRPVGDLGASSHPDILMGAPLQNVFHADDGIVWAFNGDPAAGGGAQQSWNFARLTDPIPQIGGTYGGATTGAGDIVSTEPGNEAIVGGYHFDTFTDPSNSTARHVNIVNPVQEKNLMTIPHPTGQPGDGFGVGITPMGDLNGDGFLDFAVSAYLAGVQFGGQGRAYIFKSDNSPLPTQPPPAPPPGAEPVTPQLLRAGRCTNLTLGTELADRLEGTIAGDMIFAFGGDDVVNGFQSEDCIQGGSGNDVLKGQNDNDKLIGDGGDDFLNGGDGRDDLRGAAGKDRLVGSFGRDFLAGGSGADRIFGGADRDRLFGEGGNDRISTGDGRNRVDGGRGNDVISARNGERDVINCGRGRDRVRADRGDRVGRSCERVSRGSVRRRRR